MRTARCGWPTANADGDAGTGADLANGRTRTPTAVCSSTEWRRIGLFTDMYDAVLLYEYLGYPFVIVFSS